MAARASRPHRPRPTATRAGAGGPESIGALLARLRLAAGLSQLRVAERLCAASGTPTISRHEVSRWEREERIPGGFWLGWLAVVFEVPLERLEAAVATARAGGGQPPPATDHHRFWRLPQPTELLAGLDHASTHDLRDLAHTWLTGRPDPPPAAALVRTVGFPAGPTVPDDLAQLETRLVDLRRNDDMVGGIDLAARVDRQLRDAIGLLREAVSGSVRHRRLIRLVAQFAQLAGWVHADSGDPAAARRAYRVALRTAAAVDDRPLAAYVLAGLSHQVLAAGDAAQALLLARTAHAGAGAGASARTQALLLHRAALALAHLGERRAAHAALAAARQAAARDEPAREPPWLYWLDLAELDAMTGRCLIALGRPLRACQLLAKPRPGIGPRTDALYGGYLARSYLELGEVEQACRVARRALRAAVAAASSRAVTALRHLHPLLLRHRDLTAVRAYERQAANHIAFLPAHLWGRRAGARQVAVD